MPFVSTCKNYNVSVIFLICATMCSYESTRTESVVYCVGVLCTNACNALDKCGAEMFIEEELLES